MKNRNLIIIVTAIIIIAVVSAALIYTNYNPGTTQIGAYSVTDDEGTITQFDAVPQKIVSLAPSNTQILFAIGVGDRVVAVTDYDHTPYNFTAWIAAGNMTSIGGFSTPNKETIASLKPDLILATNIHEDVTQTLRDLGYKVLVLNPMMLTAYSQT